MSNRAACQSHKRILPAALLCFFLGIWALIDFIIIVVGSFRDADGNVINLWT
ncbi:MAG: hypothetical protein JWP72_814 [Massilia sp.]|jgi:hypothetical protein|nr:hypothetical protein [Massilia sp.]MDB5792719.1 hypothetical protein [Massilia sp.]